MIIKYMAFLRVLALYEMQTALPRIWTRVVVSIFYDNNQYITSTYKYKNNYIQLTFYCLRKLNRKNTEKSEF